MAESKKADLFSFLRRRRDTLEKLCARMAVRDYNDLCGRLDALGLTHPTPEQCSGLFGKSKGDSLVERQEEKKVSRVRTSKKKKSMTRVS